MGFWIEELNEDDSGLRMDRAIARLRDEIAVLHFEHTRGHNRELAMALASLDEARHWAVEYLIGRGRLVLVDRREILREVTEATETTEIERGERVNV